MNKAEKVAWVSSISASIISVLLLSVVVFSVLRSAASAGQMNDQQKQLLQRKIMLQARIELCAMRDRGELPPGSNQCSGEERKNLASYRQEIEQIDRTIRSGVR